MVAIQTQAIFSIEGHDRKFPTRVLFCSTPSLFEVAGCESVWCILKPISIELDSDDNEVQVNEPPAKRACA